MATAIFLFLHPLPDGADYYRERHPYGPDGHGTFYTDLAIEIHPDYIKQYGHARAVVGGMLRFIPDPENTETGTLVLLPAPQATQELGSRLMSCSSLAFVYRNLDKRSVWDAAVQRIRSADDIAKFTSASPERRADSFIDGVLAIAVPGGVADGGGELGMASTSGGTDGWGLLGFEIVDIPAVRGYSAETLRTRVAQLVSPSALTRRRDPTSFYAAVNSPVAPDVTARTCGPPGVVSGLATLAPGQSNHVLLRIPTRRTLIEVRDEYDLPFADSVTMTYGNKTVSAPAASCDRGTFVLDAVAAGGSPTTVDYDISVPDHVLTELPSGQSALRSRRVQLAAPAHLGLQAVYMPQQPAAEHEEKKSWFVANTSPLLRYSEGNRVAAIRDGVAVLQAYASAMHSVREPTDFVHLVGWKLVDTFQLADGKPATTLQNLTYAIAVLGADVRVMLWDQWGTANTAEVGRINALPGGHGQAILDNDTVPIVGSHHQKYMVVKRAAGALAFCGGVDIDTSRRDSPEHGAIGAFHDVHAQIEGPAVNDIDICFAQRWNNHPDVAVDRTARPIDPLPPQTGAKPGTAYVQVACTYPRKKHYPFARDGSRVPLEAFKRAIGRAKKFIYIEDQYLTPYAGTHPESDDDNVGILEALKDALRRIDYLIIVIPNHCDQPQNRYRRKQFIQGLRQVDSQKVHVYYLGRPGPNPGPGERAIEGGCEDAGWSIVPGWSASGFCSGSKQYRSEIYVHSKVWLVDDICVKIGSANCNRRSYTHDSEMDIIVVDGALDNGVRRFALDFRLQLWGEHLQMKGASRDALRDHMQALSFWVGPPTSENAHRRVLPYLHDDDAASGMDSIWNTFVDPDGG